jgi:hypothetical protein
MLTDAKISAPGGRTSEFHVDAVRRVSEIVYRDRLGPGEAEKMVAKDGDNGQQLRERAAAYDSLTRSYMRAMGPE